MPNGEVSMPSDISTRCSSTHCSKSGTYTTVVKLWNLVTVGSLEYTTSSPEIQIPTIFAVVDKYKKINAIVLGPFRTSGWRFIDQQALLTRAIPFECVCPQWGIRLKRTWLQNDWDKKSWTSIIYNNHCIGMAAARLCTCCKRTQLDQKIQFSLHEW